MTEIEAIKWLKEMQNPMISEAELYCAETCYGLGKMVYPEPEDYVFETAIQALEEIQQYRAIGTVDECKLNKVLSDKRFEYFFDGIDLLEEYRVIGTIEEFKALKEKNEPKELAEHNFQDEVHHYLCPSCRSIVSCNQNYCDECGQALET